MSTALATGESPNQIAAPLGTAHAPAPLYLNRRQKAAVIVRYLLSEGASLSLTELPEPTIAELGRQMTTLRRMENREVNSVVLEFLKELDGPGLSFPKELSGALDLLGESVGADMVSRIRQNAGVKINGDPWVKIGEMESEKLLAVLQEESIEIGAVLLSKLKVALAAELLGQLPGERARRITYAVSQTGNIAPDVVRKIGLSLAVQLDAHRVRAFDEGPVERVGAILNFSPSSTRDDMLEGLSETDSSFAEQVRKAIFTFANIAERVEALDVPKFTREVDAVVLATALAAAKGPDEPVIEFILSNMSKRMADTLREDMEALGEVKDRVGEAAMTAVVGAIRGLEAAGEITFIVEEEE